MTDFQEPPVTTEPARLSAGRATVVIFGGGINGAALARQLVLSNIDVVITDTGDLASGTTAWSTRLIHGGLRYLEYGEFDLVRESLAERNRLTRLAPHLVRPLRFAIPLTRRGGGLLAAAARFVGWESLARRLSGGGRGSLAVGIGLWLYDRFAGDPAWPAHQMHRSTAAGLPRVDRHRFPFVATYFDAQCLAPERLTVEWLVDARRVAVERQVSLHVRPHHSWQMSDMGELVLTPLGLTTTGTALRVRPTAIVNATGAWVDQTIAALTTAAGPLSPVAQPQQFIRGTKGSHLIIDNSKLHEAIGGEGVYAEAGDGRPIFVLPFLNAQVLVGTTDIPFSGDPGAARPDPAEIDYLLAAVSAIFPDCPLRTADVVQHYCGVRPLPGPDVTGRQVGSPGAVTRRHLLVRHPQAAVPTWSIVGGKLTTCRSLAEESAAEILRTLHLPAADPQRDRPLPGWLATDDQVACRAATTAAAEAAGVPAAAVAAAVESTLHLFGGQAAEVFRVGGGVVASRGLPPLLGDSGLPTAAAVFAIEQEWAATLADLVERRLMLLFAPRLSQATLTALAEVLVATGRLEANAVVSVVAAEVAHLQDCCGKRVEPVVDQHVRN
jgi:glycerol-3-phosphate dehydrogenase